MNMAKFCANLNFMFPELNNVERYAMAKSAGFKAVESGFPIGNTKQEVTDALRNSGLKQILINVYTGDTSKGEMGFAAIPGKESEFKTSIETTIAYAKSMDIKKIHIMSGIVESPTQENDDCYIKNLKCAAKLLEANNIVGVIEPINKYSVKNYYMNCYDKALNAIKSINSSNLRLMVDIYHLQRIRGNLATSLLDFKDYIGHVQIAQVPDRNEPNTPGEVNFKYIFDVLKNIGYNDWIGLEYKPKDDAVTGLKWLQEFKYSL